MPSVRLTVDDEELAPNEISRFDGQRLHFFVAGGQEPLVAFTTAERAQRYLAETPSPQPRQETARQRELAEREEYGAIFYSDAHFRGDELWWRVGSGHPDLRRERRGVFWLWTWNDSISSLLVGLGRTATCWEHGGYRGSSITFNGIGDEWLTEYGWNDRISSFQLW